MMKKTLRESLVDYDMATLRALADVRGAVLTSTHQETAADELSAQLSTLASLAIALTDLSPAETGALVTLRVAGGWMEAPRFARHFGAVRSMGPARLEREQPWLSPANPAEGLWYHGLIFKDFQQTEVGPAEVIYIPDDLLALLQKLSPGELSSSEEDLEVMLNPVAPPSHVRPANTDIVEDVFGVLVTARNRTPGLSPDGSLRLKGQQAINALCISPVPAADVTDDDRLALVVHLARAAELIITTQGRLVLNPHPARAWLQTTPAHRLLALQTAWRDDPGWNDLWHVPSLKPQPTGWKNDPVWARHKVLGFLSRCRPGDWYRLDEFTAAIKSSDPDFQRPDGDYTTWYIHDLNGQPLMGFEHWDEVEGALLRYLVSGPLHWLGITDLGLDGGDFGHPAVFRLAEAGLSLLKLASPPAAEPLPSESVSVPSLAVRDDLTLRVSADASLYDRFQVARFADFLEREPDRISYRISLTSLARARRQGITSEQVNAFLVRVSGGHVSSKVLDDLRVWQDRGGTVRLEQSTVLRVDHPETLKALRRHPAIGPLLGEVLGPQAVLIPRANVGQVRRWLANQGYLEN
ncbi:MAG: helicase-associated domain-containing protein [Anaerolineae bacterium]|jgi:hypothetical protein